MLPVDLKLFPEIEINNIKFFSKSNYHVSLVNLCDYSEAQQEKIFEYAQIFTRDYPIKIKELTHTFRLVTENDQRSIIVLVEMSGLNQLISSINKHFDYEFAYPPTHITLYTPKGQFGIGIDTQERYQQLTQVIDSQKTKKLINSFLK